MTTHCHLLLHIEKADIMTLIWPTCLAFLFWSAAVALEVDDVQPSYQPGDVMDSIELSTINEALDDILSTTDEDVSRRCAIAVANEGSKTLVSPSWYMEAGEIHTALPPTVEDGQTALALMVRDWWSWDGVNGVLTYDLSGTEFQVAIMWAVPYYDNLYETRFNMKVYPKFLSPDKSMFDQMYESAGSWTTGSWQQRVEFGTRLYGSITDRDDAKLIVYIDSNDLDVTHGPSHHVWCDSWGFGDWCRRECYYPFGDCWTDDVCTSDAQCNSDMQCSEKCS